MSHKINLAITIIGFFAWIIAGFVTEMIYYVFWAFLLGFVGIALFYVLSYLGCLFLYAFAEMVENSTILVSLKKLIKNKKNIICVIRGYVIHILFTCLSNFMNYVNIFDI